MSFQADLEYHSVIRRIKQLITQRMYLDASDALQGILKSRKNDPQVLLLLIEVKWLETKREEAITLLRSYLQKYPEDGNAQLRLAEFQVHRGKFTEAINHLKRLWKKYPDNLSIRRELAHVYEMKGENDEARKLLDPFVSEHREDPEMARLYANLEIQEKRYESAIEIVTRHISNERVPDDMKKKMWYQLGLSNERLGKTDIAYQAYQMANQIDTVDFDSEEHSDFNRRMKAVFSPDHLDSIPFAGNDDETPVFVISRPRSGSTLVERIIGSHPKAHAAGELLDLSNLINDLSFIVGSTLELPECILDMDQEDMDVCAKKYLDVISELEDGTKRVTNKNIAHYKHVGLISRMLPKARFIDLRRSPLDNCMACWMIDLGKHFPGSFRLEHLAFEYRLYVEMMEHWHSCLEVPIFRLNYEDLVADQETWSRKMIDFLGLPWDDQCLRFYDAGKKHNKTMSAAPTLSYNQVTQPIFKTSVGRAEQFREHLGPVRNILNIPVDEYPLGHDLRF